MMQIRLILIKNHIEIFYSETIDLNETKLNWEGL